MTLEEIDEKIKALRAQKESAIAELRELVRERESLIKLEALRAQVEGMSDKDKKALAQIIAPVGIASAEKVNGQ